MAEEIINSFSLDQINFGKIILDYMSDPEMTDIEIWEDELWYTCRRDSLIGKGGRHKANFEERYSLEEISEFHECVSGIGRQLSILMKHPFNENAPFLDGETDYKGRALIRINVMDGSITSNGKLAIGIRIIPYQVSINRKMMIEEEYVSKEILDLFEACVYSKNVFCAIGPTGTGKTTLLKYLIRYIPDGVNRDTGNQDYGDAQAIITMEDTLEAWIKKIYPTKNVLALKTNNHIGYSEMIKYSLRQFPDWIIISECRAEEVITLLESISTGHAAMTSIHAESAQALPDRMVEMSKHTGQAAERIYLQAHRSIDIGAYIHMWYDKDGVHRKITEVCEYYVDNDGKAHQHLIANYNFETNEYEYEPIRSEKIRRRMIQTKTNIEKIRDIFWERKDV